MEMQLCTSTSAGSGSGGNNGFTGEEGLMVVIFAFLIVHILFSRQIEHNFDL
jgi:hypothetical protein